MRDSIKDFFSALHQDYLKPSGYKKLRHTFSRDMGEYTEKIQFQGCSWNDSKSAWRFYINFGIEFHDLPPVIPMDFSGTHCSARLDSIMANSPKHFHITETGSPKLAQELSVRLEQLSNYISERIGVIRESYPIEKFMTLRTLK
jgi:Domain of unknown function (DUF4304)